MNKVGKMMTILIITIHSALGNDGEKDEEEAAIATGNDDAFSS